VNPLVKSLLEAGLDAAMAALEAGKSSLMAELHAFNQEAVNAAEAIVEGSLPKSGIMALVGPQLRAALHAAAPKAVEEMANEEGRLVDALALFLREYRSSLK